MNKEFIKKQLERIKKLIGEIESVKVETWGTYNTVFVLSEHELSYIKDAVDMILSEIGPKEGTEK